MLVNPKKVVFEKTNDIVDYVTQGFLPPPERYFHQVIRKLRNPDLNDSRRGQEAIILDDVVPEEERATIDVILTRVHRNRIRNRNRFLIGLGTVATALMVNSSMKKKKKARLEEKFIKEFEDELYDDEEEDY